MERVIRFKKVLVILDWLINGVLVLATILCLNQFMGELRSQYEAEKEYEENPTITKKTCCFDFHGRRLTAEEIRGGKLIQVTKVTDHERPKPPSQSEVAKVAVIPLCIVLVLYLVKVLSFGIFYVLIQIAENTYPLEEVTDDSSEES
jgi:hypothetical protein